MNKKMTYYQPISKGAFCELPYCLASFQVFETIEECVKWLEIHHEDVSAYDIVEYHDDDIEFPTFLDRYGFSIKELNESNCTDLGEPITKDYYKDTPTSDLFAIVADECDKETILSVAEGYIGDTEIREFLFACLGFDIE